MLVRFSPAGVELAHATLTDQFGVSYEFHGGYGDLRTGDDALLFAPPNNVTSFLGMRFTLTLALMDSSGQTVPGSWVIHGIALSNTAVNFRPPPSVSVGNVTIQFSGGREADGIIELTARLSGVTVDQLGLSRKQQPGESPPLDVRVSDSSGRVLDGTYVFAPDGDGISIDILAFGAPSHGTYTIRISIQGAGVVTRSIAY